jgi:hypothetical protein
MMTSATRIERGDVVDIDHPGEIGRVVGGITTGVGGFFLLLAPFATDCSSREPGAGSHQLSPIRSPIRSLAPELPSGLWHLSREPGSHQVSGT